MNARRRNVSELPEDLQVLIYGLVEDSLGELGGRRLEAHRFLVKQVPLSAFPIAKMWTDYRSSSYAKAMIGQNLPPVIICGEKWLDGRHRVWAARQSGKIKVDCIDLSEIGASFHTQGLGTLDLDGVEPNSIVFQEDHFSKLPNRLGRRRKSLSENLS